MTQRYLSGLEGEGKATEYLKSRGFQLVQSRFKSRHGEVDLIARKEGILYFIEVKYRPDSRLGSGLMSITAEKKLRLMDAAGVYLIDHPGTWRLSYLEITRAGVYFVEDVLHEN